MQCKTEIFARRGSEDQWASATEKKRNILDNLTLKKAYRPVLGFLSDQKDLVLHVLTLDLIENVLWLFLYTHGKLDLTFV